MAWCLDTVSVAWIKRAATKDYRDWILAWLILSVFLIATPSWRWGAESVKNPWLLASLCLSEKELAKSFRQMSISPRLTWGQRIEMLSLLARPSALPGGFNCDCHIPETLELSIVIAWNLRINLEKNAFFESFIFTVLPLPIYFFLGLICRPRISDNCFLN